MERERAAWNDLERVSRPSDADEIALRVSRERWQDAAHTLVNALRALKR